MTAVTRGLGLFVSTVAALGFCAALLGNPSLARADTQSITVRGEWEIRVSEPDGTLVQRHVFQNALTEGGAKVLVALLSVDDAQVSIVGGGPYWTLSFAGGGLDTSRADCRDLVGTGDFQFGTAFGNIAALEPAAGAPFTNSSFTVVRTIQVPDICLPGGGTYFINKVGTGTDLERPLEGGGNEGFASSFSEKVLDTPINDVVANQVVTARVTFSFE